MEFIGGGRRQKNRSENSKQTGMLLTPGVGNQFFTTIDTDRPGTIGFADTTAGNPAWLAVSVLDGGKEVRGGEGAFGGWLRIHVS